MAARRPLVLVGGNFSELPSGDTILGAGGLSEFILHGVPCDTSVFVGSAVRFDKISFSNQHMNDWDFLSGLSSIDFQEYDVIAVNALANSMDNAMTIGIVESKDSASVCNIRFMGASGSIFYGLDSSSDYYLSDVFPGVVVKYSDRPTMSGSVLCKIGKPISSSKFLVSVGDRTVI